MNFLNKKTKIKIMSQLLLGATVVGLGVNCIPSKEIVITHALEDENINQNEVKQIAVGDQYSFLLKNDGTVWACGKNSSSSLGIGNSTSTSKFVEVNIDKVSKIICNGTRGTFFLKNDGTVWACGQSSSGSFGLTTDTKYYSTPVQITSVSDIKDVICGNATTFFIKNDNTILACGLNNTGQLGIGRTGNISTPIKIDISDVKMIASGLSHTLFLKNDGTLYSVGSNGNGQLGTNGQNSSVLVQIMTDVSKIYAGPDTSFVIKNDGTVWGCGANYCGTLATGNTQKQTTFIKLDISNVREIVTQKTQQVYDSVFFIKEDGTTYACGYQGYGKLGNVTNGTDYVTSIIKTQINNPKEIYSSGFYTIIRDENNHIYYAGNNQYGQMGNGTTLNSGVPITNVTSLYTNWTNYTLSKINNNLENYGKYGSLSSIIYGDSKYDFNTYNNELPVAYSKDLNATLSTLDIDNSELRIKEITPNGSMVTVDNYGSVQFYQTLTSSPVDIKTDGTTINSVEYGMLDQTPVVMFYKNDGSVWYFEPTGSTISLKMLPIEQTEFTETNPYLDKNAQIKYFLFEKTNGDLVYFDSNRFEQSVGVNMNDIKAIIPSTSNNSTMYLMNDGTLKYLNSGTATDVTLPDELTIASMLSNRYAVMSDGYIYAIHNNAIVDTGVLASATQTACNNVLWMKNGSIRQLNTSGSLVTLSDVNGKLVKSIVAFDNNNSYILNKDGSTYGVGNLVATTDLLDKNIDYNEIVGFISNNTSSTDAKLLVMKDGTVYENPSDWTKSATIYFNGKAMNQIKTEFNVSFDGLEQATSAVETAEKMLTQDTYNHAQGLVTLLDESTEKTALQGRLDIVQNTINQIKLATESVVKAETSKSQADKDSAQILVTALPEYTQKIDLQNRLNNIVAEKSALELATEAVVNAETTKLETDINSAEGLVTALDDSTEKTDLQNRLNALKEEKLLADATTKVVKAESTVIQADVDVAQIAIDKLKDGTDKTNFQNRLDKVQEKINKNKEEQVEKDLLADATKKVEKAESTITQSDVDIAQTAINKLKDGDGKIALQDRLNKVKNIIAKISEATGVVVKAEGTKAQVDINTAQSLVTALPECTQKTNLQNRLDTLNKIVEDEKEQDDLLANATKKVEKAESTITQTDVDIAQLAIDKLEDGEDKTNLQGRLDSVKGIIVNITEATQAVVKAEGTKVQVDINTAQSLVTVLPTCNQKTELQNRLDTLIKTVQDEKEQDGLLADATSKVVKAENTVTQSDVNIAQTAIDKLKPSEDKTAIQERLDKVQEKINKNKEEQAEKDLLADATTKVVKAESTVAQSDVYIAQTAVNKLPQGDVRNDLQARLDKIKEDIAKEEEDDAYNNLLDDAIKKVKKAESSKTDYNIKVAQNAVNKLPQNEDRKGLQDRLDALRTQIEEDKAGAQLLRVATTNVELAEASINRSNADSYFTNAQAKIDKLKSSEGKTALQQRLDIALEKYNNKKNANLINVATQHVRLAEAYKNNRTLGKRYKTQAYETVNNLSNCQEKTDFLARLDKLN